MSRHFLRTAAAAVRLWTRIYTWRLPPQQRQARLDEIESDLWESIHDPDVETGSSLPLEMLGRLLFGMPDDVSWRFEQRPEAGPLRPALVVATLAVAAGVTAAILLGANAVPPPAPGPPRVSQRRAPPPPPPPPPPCAPPAFPREPGRECGP